MIQRDRQFQGEPGIGPDLAPPFTAEDEATRWLFALNRRGIRPGRNEIESVNRPVVCGGVLVVPGDVVVADGDGVVVVPRGVAADVARYARRILDADKAGRRELYRQLGLPEDPSIE